MAMPTYTSVAEYDAACTDEGRAALGAVREITARLVPEHEERLSYGIPTLFVRGKRVVHYAGWAEHLALYPIPESPHDDPTLREDLTPFVKGKGTLHFRYAVGLPLPLIERVVRAHLHRIAWPLSHPASADSMYSTTPVVPSNTSNQQGGGSV